MKSSFVFQNQKPPQNAHTRSGAFLHSIHHLCDGLLTGALITFTFSQLPWSLSLSHMCLDKLQQKILCFLSKAFFIIFQSFEFDGSVEDVEVCDIFKRLFSPWLNPLRKSSMRKPEKYFVTKTTRIVCSTRWRGSPRAWSWPSSCPSESWLRAGMRCSTATTSTSARSTGASLSWSSSSSSSTSSLPWWGTPTPRWTQTYFSSSPPLSPRSRQSRTSGWDSGQRRCWSQKEEFLPSELLVLFVSSQLRVSYC